MEENENLKINPNKKSFLKKFLTPFVFLAIGILKFSKYLFLILKFGKFGTLITMIISIWAYSWKFGWPFAFGFVILILIHELGHALVLRKEGLSTGPVVFIPFMGAVIAMKDNPRDAWIEAKVGIGGPLFGTLGAFMTLFIGLATGQEIFFALASSGFFLNLFNMLPLSPMDGGRVIGALSPHLMWVGLVLGIGIFYLNQSPILFLMLMLGVMRLWQLYKNPVQGYFDIPLGKKITMGLMYFGLIAILLYGMSFSVF